MILLMSCLSSSLFHFILLFFKTHLPRKRNFFSSGVNAFFLYLKWGVQTAEMIFQTCSSVHYRILFLCPCCFFKNSQTAPQLICCSLRDQPISPVLLLLLRPVPGRIQNNLSWRSWHPGTFSHSRAIFLENRPFTL